MPLPVEVVVLSRSGGRVQRTYVVLLLVVVVGASTLAVLEDRPSAGVPARPTHPTGLAPYGRPPVVGILGASGHFLGRERASGITAVTLSVAWSQAEPGPGSFSSSYLASVRRRIAAATGHGFEVVLDPGLQYPPDWVFLLPGGTRFVNQFGDRFGGAPGSGDDVANGVTDLSVRHAQAVYLAWLGAHLPAHTLAAVREGGGPLGELRYPGPDYRGRTDSYWAYDPDTQADLPAAVRGWVPGTGTTAQARTFLDAYNARMVGYGRWLDGVLRADFSTEELVLLPGWGERPGGAPTEVAARLALPMDEFNEGLDWADLLDSLPDPAHTVAYTTYLDAPSVQPTLALEDPADFLAYLTQDTAVRLGGENTGNGSMADLRLSLHRARLLDFAIVQWMDEAQLIASTAGRDPSGPTFNLLKTAVAS